MSKKHVLEEISSIISDHSKGKTTIETATKIMGDYFLEVTGNVNAFINLVRSLRKKQQELSDKPTNKKLIADVRQMELILDNWLVEGDRPEIKFKYTGEDMVEFAKWMSERKLLFNDQSLFEWKTSQRNRLKSTK